MKAWIVVTLTIVIIAFFQNMRTENEEYEESLQQGKAYQFLSYASAFDEYFESHTTSSGDMTKSITRPSWVPPNDNIKMYISDGRGYVFMPSEKGVFSEIMMITEYSLLVGITDESAINIISGAISKPSFIPRGYIVYVR